MKREYEYDFTGKKNIIGLNTRVNKKKLKNLDKSGNNETKLKDLDDGKSISISKEKLQLCPTTKYYNQNVYLVEGKRLVFPSTYSNNLVLTTLMTHRRIKPHESNYPEPGQRQVMLEDVSGWIVEMNDGTKEWATTGQLFRNNKKKLKNATIDNQFFHVANMLEAHQKPKNNSGHSTLRDLTVNSKDTNEFLHPTNETRDVELPESWKKENIDKPPQFSHHSFSMFQPIKKNSTLVLSENAKTFDDLSGWFPPDPNNP